MDELQIRAISPKLIKAYKEAIYVVHLGDREIALQVNKASLQLAKLMEEWEVPTAAFLTAFNPYSQTLDAKENEARQKRMWFLGNFKAGLARLSVVQFIVLK